MGRSSFWWLAAVAALTSVMAGRLTAEIPCTDVVAHVVPCESFLTSWDVAPSAECCSLVRSLDEIAIKSQADRKAICRCFKDASRSFVLNPAKADKLPVLCKASERVAIHPKVDCDRI